jgi:hypothetical protein
VTGLTSSPSWWATAEGSSNWRNRCASGRSRKRTRSSRPADRGARARPEGRRRRGAAAQAGRSRASRNPGRAAGRAALRRRRRSRWRRRSAPWTRTCSARRRPPSGLALRPRPRPRGEGGGARVLLAVPMTLAAVHERRTGEKAVAAFERQGPPPEYRGSRSRRRPPAEAQEAAAELTPADLISDRRRTALNAEIFSRAGRGLRPRMDLINDPPSSPSCAWTSGSWRRRSPACRERGRQARLPAREIEKLLRT